MWKLNIVFSIKIGNNLKCILITNSFDLNVLHFIRISACIGHFRSAELPLCCQQVGSPWWFIVYVVQSIRFRTEFFALVRSVVNTQGARAIIPKLSWASVLKGSFLCASCVTQLQLLSRGATFSLRLSRWRSSVNLQQILFQVRENCYRIL